MYEGLKKMNYLGAAILYRLVYWVHITINFYQSKKKKINKNKQMNKMKKDGGKYQLLFALEFFVLTPHWHWSQDKLEIRRVITVKYIF